jgi:hypothetical protein
VLGKHAELVASFTQYRYATASKRRLAGHLPPRADFDASAGDTDVTRDR